MRVILYFFVAVLTLLQLTGCSAANLIPSAESGESLNMQKEETTQPIEDKSSDILYIDILADYEKIVEFRLSDTFESDWNSGRIIAVSDTLLHAQNDENEERATYGLPLNVKWSYMLVDMTDELENPKKSSFGYILKDINGDSIPELFWVREDGVVLAVFAVRDKQPVLLDAFWPRYDCVITNKGELYTLAAGGAGYDNYDIRSLTSSGKLSVVKSFGSEGWSAETGVQYYELISGEKTSISESQFYALLQEYPFRHGSSWEKVYINFLPD